MKRLMQWILTGKGFLDKMAKNHVGAYAAQSAYFMLMSVIPMLLMFVTLIRFLPITEQDFFHVLMELVPGEFEGLLRMITGEVFSYSSAALPVSAVIAAWSAAKGIQSLYNGLNVIFNVPVVPNYIKARLISAVYTVIFVLAIALTLVLMVFGTSLQQALITYIPFIGEMTAHIVHLRGLITMAFLFVTFLILYTCVPNRKATFRSQIPGAVFSAVTWILFSFVFSIYVSVSNSLSNMYGSLTTLIMAMLWLYFCMYILMIGAEINAYFEDRFRRQRIKQKEIKQK